MEDAQSPPACMGFPIFPDGHRVRVLEQVYPGGRQRVCGKMELNDKFILVQKFVWGAGI